MNIRLRAIGRTASLFTIATLVPFLILELFQLESETLFSLFLLSFLSWMVWVVYTINLHQLENEESRKELDERRQTMIAGIVDKK